MPKIVQPPPPFPEYLITCPVCRAVISFASNEVRTSWHSRGDYEDRAYDVTCPNCHVPMNIPDNYGTVLKKVGVSQ